MSLSRTLNLFRAFVPTWRFFEDVGPMPLLLYRAELNGKDPAGPWLYVLPRPKRSALSLFFNPQGNYLLACGNLLQHLLTDLEEADENRPEAFEQSVSFQLVKRLVRFELAQRHGSSHAIRYQFKICSLVQGADEEQMEDVLISPVYEEPADASQ